MTFSERMGFKTVRSILQADEISSELRIGLWNAVLSSLELLKSIPIETSSLDYYYHFEDVTEKIWRDFFKKPGDDIPEVWDSRQKELRAFFFDCAWYEVYDFIEFFADGYLWDKDDFIDRCNTALKREVSAYRFVDTKIVPVTTEHEIAAIEDALAATNTPTQLALVHDHLKQALAHLVDRHTPDYRNSMKESICAVESLCKLIANNPKAELGPALDAIQKTGAQLHPALVDAFKKLYGYTSDADGIRHALKDEPTVDVEDARYMLVMCAGFVSYLIEKARKAGITL